MAHTTSDESIGGTDGTDGGTARIPLYRCGQVVAWTLVTAADAGWLGRWQWHPRYAGSQVYASRIERRDGRRVVILMHREVLGLPAAPGNRHTLVVDHINGDGLDNQRANLRACTQAENAQNRFRWSGKTSRYRGVSRSAGKWVAMVKLHGRVHYLGSFEREEDAALMAASYRSRHMPFSQDARG